MPITFPTTADFLDRASSIPDWTGSRAFGCWVKMAVQPTAAQYIPVWLVGDSSLTNPYVRIFIDAAGLKLQLWDGVTLTTSTAYPIIPDDRWLPIFFIYNIVSNLVTLQTASSSPRFVQVIDISAFTFVENEEWFASDDSGSGNIIAGLEAFQTRTFSITSSQGIAQFDETSLQLFYPGVYDTYVLSSVILDTNTDLLDQTTNGNDWTSHGTPGTDATSPYDLTADGFEDNFDDGTYSPWTDTINSDLGTLGVGSLETCAFACASNAPIGIGRTITTSPYPTEGTVNFDYAMNWASGTGEMLVFLAEYIPSLNYLGFGTGTYPGFRIHTHDDGSVDVSILTFPSESTTTSATAVIPSDGSPVGIQITWELDTLDLTVDVYVNADLVVTGTHTYASLDFPHYNTISLTGSVFGATAWDLRDNFVYNSAYNGLTPPDAPIDINDLLDTPCTVPQPEITGMTINCITKQLTVTGTGFTELDTWELQGPGAVIIPTSVISVTPTVVVLDVPDFEASGEYCLSVFNPTDCD